MPIAEHEFTGSGGGYTVEDRRSVPGWTLGGRHVVRVAVFPSAPVRSVVAFILVMLYGRDLNSPNTLFLGPAITIKYGEWMELRHLRYFVAIAEELNFTHAAARLHVAQPALSSQIKDLEQEIDAQLFDRRRTGVQLTRAGKAFYTRARAILAQTAEAVTEARTAAGTITGSLVLGFLSGLH